MRISKFVRIFLFVVEKTYLYPNYLDKKTKRILGFFIKHAGIYLRVPVLVRETRTFGVRIVFVEPVIAPVSLVGGIGAMRVDPVRVDPVRVEPVRVEPVRVAPELLLSVIGVSEPVLINTGEMIAPEFSLAPVFVTAPVCTRSTTTGVTTVIGEIASILLVFVTGKNPRV